MEKEEWNKEDSGREKKELNNKKRERVKIKRRRDWKRKGREEEIQLERKKKAWKRGGK